MPSPIALPSMPEVGSDSEETFDIPRVTADSNESLPDSILPIIEIRPAFEEELVIQTRNLILRNQKQ